jgi:YD repeat-containing protein
MVTAGSSCGLPEKSRWELVSNPYRSASSTDAEVPALLETKGWTRLRYDALGRMTHSTSFTGPALPCPWGSNATTSGQTVTVYDADQRTVTDPAQKAIRHRTDALGRVVEVVEDPGGLNYITGYTYDVLDNLTGVTQDRVSPAATQSRSFVYSSLSRLTQATNPETKPDAQAHSTSYVYTNNGQLFSRTDGRGVTTTMTYDALDRVLTRSYSDGTPGVSYSYDTCANGKGRLCQVSNSASTTQYTYDDLGRIVTSKQVMGTPEYAFAYEYNLADNLTKLTYPSGREVLTGYAKNGRAVQLQGRPSATGTLVSYANNAVYWAHGAAARMDMEAGTRKQEWCFNARLQMVGMRVGAGASAQPNCALFARRPGLLLARR